MERQRELIADLTSVNIVELSDQLSLRAEQNQIIAYFCADATETIEGRLGFSPFERALRLPRPYQPPLVHPEIITAYAGGTSLAKSALPELYTIALYSGRRLSSWLADQIPEYLINTPSDKYNSKKHRHYCLEAILALSAIERASDKFCELLHDKEIPEESENKAGLAMAESFSRVAELYDCTLWFDTSEYADVAKYLKRHLTIEELGNIQVG